MVADIGSDSPPVRKKRGPKPTGKTPQVNVRLSAEITTTLDRFVDGEAIRNRSEAIRHIVTDWLRANQMLPAARASEGARTPR